ncbi:hypothetical protein [Yersinia nurmii]|nr:hypothetical protein [Yersinia nurmii]
MYLYFIFHVTDNRELNLMNIHRTFVIALISTPLICNSIPAMSAIPIQDGIVEQTLIFVRHAEKPEAGLGQINCQGLNRSLALPKVIKNKYGKPDFIFAPDPTRKKADFGYFFYYLRPLATIEPTAIYFNMPINIRVGQSETGWLINQLQKSKYSSAKVLISWAHHEIMAITKALMTEYNGELAQIPEWENTDFDSIYVLKIVRSEGANQISFTHDQQGLNGLPLNCPEISPPRSNSLPGRSQQ